MSRANSKLIEPKDCLISTHRFRTDGAAGTQQTCTDLYFVTKDHVLKTHGCDANNNNINTQNNPLSLLRSFTVSSPEASCAPEAAAPSCATAGDAATQRDTERLAGAELKHSVISVRPLVGALDRSRSNSSAASLSTTLYLRRRRHVQACVYAIIHTDTQHDRGHGRS